MNRSTPGLPVHHQLPEFTQTHVHWVRDAIQPSHPRSSPSPPAFNLSQHQGFNLGHTGFPYFKYEFCNKEFITWATVSSPSCFCWLYRASLFLAAKEYNQSELGVGHLVLSTCNVFSCVVGRGSLLWPVHSLGKTQLAFALLHSVLQGQICLLLQVSLDFLLLDSSPL